MEGYMPRPLGSERPKSLIKTITKVLQVYHHLAAICLLTDPQIAAIDHGVWDLFPINWDGTDRVVLLHEYYTSVLKTLWQYFCEHYTTRDIVIRETAKAWKVYNGKLKGALLAQKSAFERLEMWLNCMSNEVETTSMVFPRCHQRGLRHQEKLKEWKLPTFTKMVAIVGDSNLARIKPFNHHSCQVESFPGARIEHLSHLFGHYNGPAPEFLVLSIGINDCTRSQDLQDGLNNLLDRLPTQFRPTKIYVAELQVSQRQPPPVRRKADQLNCSVPCGITIIPALPGLETIHDNVHWSPEFAQALVHHWLGYLHR